MRAGSPDGRSLEADIITSPTLDQKVSQVCRHDEGWVDGRGGESSDYKFPNSPPAIQACVCECDVNDLIRKNSSLKKLFLI